MDDKKLMHITLGVHSPWFVKSVEPDGSEERIDIYILISSKEVGLLGKKWSGETRFAPQKIEFYSFFLR